MPRLALALVNGRVIGKVGNAVTDFCFIITFHCLIKNNAVFNLIIVLPVR